MSRGTFDGSGNLSWSGPTFINQTTSPSTLNDKEWIAIDDNASSPFRDRIYVTFTRFLFNAHNGAYTQSPIFFASSSDGGATFTTPKSIAGNVLYSQGSRPVVRSDGSLYVFWDGAKRHDPLDSTWVVKSTDGGATWSKPIQIAPLDETEDLADTLVRVNSFHAAAVAPNGDVYATWTTETTDGSVAMWSKSTNGGTQWTPPARVFTAATRTPIGYPVAQPSDGTLDAPDPAGAVEGVFPAVAIGPNGNVYFSAYRGDVVSPWQTCASANPSPESRINCLVLGDYVDNTRLDYVVRDATTGVTPSASSSHRRRSIRRTSPFSAGTSRTIDVDQPASRIRAGPAALGPATIRVRTYGGDLASTWSIHPDELQAEVAGWPRKSTGKTQVRRTISHSPPRET